MLELRSDPGPQRLNFLRRPAFAGIFGHAEAFRDRILIIDARREHRLGQDAELRQVSGGIAGPRATRRRRTLIEDKSRLAFCQIDGAERAGRRLDVQVGRARRQETDIGGFRDDAHGFAVGAGRIEDGKREARIGDPLQNCLQPRQSRGFELLDQNLCGALAHRRRWPQRAKDPCGSKSSAMTRSPALAAATAREAASVVFPAPPFCVTNAIVRIANCYTRRDTVTESARCKVTTTFGCGREKHGADFLLKRIGFGAVH